MQDCDGCGFVRKVKPTCRENLLLIQCNFIVCIQNRINDVSKKDSGVHYPEESDQVQNGFCVKRLVHDVKKNGLKMNGHCVSTKGNGLMTNGHVKNGHCLLVDGNGRLVKKGYEKNGHWKLVGDGVTKNGTRENGYCSVVRRGQKDGHTGKGRSTVTEEASSIEDERCSEKTASAGEVPHDSSHIKVSCHMLLDVQRCWLKFDRLC